MRTLTPPEIFAVVNTLNAANNESIGEILHGIDEKTLVLITDLCEYEKSIRN